MKLPEALRRQVEGQAPTDPATIRAHVYAGSTRAMAADFGVTERTVQRWVAGTRQARGRSLAERQRLSAKLASSGRRAARRQWVEAHGGRAAPEVAVQLVNANYRIIGPGQEYVRRGTIPAGQPWRYAIPTSPLGGEAGEYWATFLDNIGRGHYTAASGDLLAAFALSYGIGAAAGLDAVDLLRVDDLDALRIETDGP